MENRPNISAEEALEMMSEVHPEIHRGLDVGCSRATAFFEAGGNETKDRSLQSMLVRYWAKSYLQGKFPAVQFDKVSLCGISILLESLQYRSMTCAVQLKVWKSADKTLPSPGESNHKLGFYTQPILFPDPEDGNSEGVLRLAVLWNLTGDGVLEKLWLVAPKKFNPSNGAIDVWWDIQIPDPATGVLGVTQSIPDTRPDLGEIQKRTKKKEQLG